MGVVIRSALCKMLARPLTAALLVATAASTIFCLVWQLEHTVSLTALGPPCGCTDHKLITLCPGKEAIVDFGAVPCGGRAEKQFSIYNASPSAVNLGRIVTTCACLKVKSGTVVVQPKQTVIGTLILDLRDEPGFAGDLLIGVEVASEDSNQLSALMFRVGVNVR